MSEQRCIVDSPVGPLELRARDGALTGLGFDPGEPPSGAPAGGVLAEAAGQLEEYFAGERRAFDLPLRFTRGSAFERRVWHALLGIPYGRTTTYGALAAALGDPGLARAVGAANGRNPIAIVVPCHRVVGANGRLVGYGGGLERKRALLALEGAAAAEAAASPQLSF
jgi:methylated-DNA-[protein]-cysteine S-methyltransferase